MESHYLDIRTLNFIIILFSCIYAISLLCYQYTQSKIKGLKTFAISLLFIGLGPFLLGFRDSAPDWLTIILSNTIIIIGFLLTLYGVIGLQCKVLKQNQRVFFSLPKRR